jgi:negative regulator of flagellin synthesis FlgM
MNVNSLPDQSISAASVATSKATDRVAAPVSSAASTPAENPAASVEVKLSPVTQTMTNGVARSGTDVFNAEKVEAMRTAISNGTFSVNPGVIADKLLSNAREMLGVASAAPQRPEN